jgi:hypothetical protein
MVAITQATKVTTPCEEDCRKTGLNWQVSEMLEQPQPG